jgi:hypothetical protein
MEIKTDAQKTILTLTTCVPGIDFGREPKLLNRILITIRLCWMELAMTTCADQLG